MHTTYHDGIAFIEGRPPNCQLIKTVKIELGGIFDQAQLKSLSDVKSALAAKAKQSDGNAIVDFSYGQRSVGWFRSLFQLDDVNWYGSGTIAHVPSERV
jgi:hypothetical protein